LRLRGQRLPQSASDGTRRPDWLEALSRLLERMDRRPAKARGAGLSSRPMSHALPNLTDLLASSERQSMKPDGDDMLKFNTGSRRRALCALAFSGLAMLAGPTAAQEAWPNKPVRLIVTFPPGGLLDIVSRMLAPKLSETFGQQFVVENRPGANGNIGGEIAAKSEADGYTLLATSADMVAVNPYLYKMGFDPAKDLSPITQLVK